MQGPFWGWPHSTVTAVAFQEGNGPCPSGSGNSPSLPAPPRENPFLERNPELALPSLQLREQREGVPSCGGTSFSSTPRKGRPSLLTYPRAEGRTRDFKSIFLPCLSIDLLSQLVFIHPPPTPQVGTSGSPLLLCTGDTMWSYPFSHPQLHRQGGGHPTLPLPGPQSPTPPEPAAPTHSHHLREVAG